jgi:hypothetical protein
MADTSQRRSGVFSLNIDGTDYDIMDGVTYVLSRVKREPRIGISGPQGYKETFVNGQIKAKISDSQGYLATLFANLTSSTVIGHAANGKTVTGSAMYVSEVIEVDPIEGTFEVTFLSDTQVREIQNA